MNESRIAFTVDAVPVAQPRQRHRLVNPQHGKAFVHNYTPTKDPVNVFKASVRMAARQVYEGPPLEGPIQLDVVFVLPRPRTKLWKTKPMPRYEHTGKPDRDNLMKALKDALTKLLWRDDSQVCAGTTVKWVAAGDEAPHVEVEVSVL